MYCLVHCCYRSCFRCVHCPFFFKNPPAFAFAFSFRSYTWCVNFVDVHFSSQKKCSNPYTKEKENCRSKRKSPLSNHPFFPFRSLIFIFIVYFCVHFHIYACFAFEGWGYHIYSSYAVAFRCILIQKYTIFSSMVNSFHTISMSRDPLVWWLCMRCTYWFTLDTVWCSGFC